VSEQDFFFDEEPDTKAPATKGAKAPVKAPVKSSPKASSSAAATPAPAGIPVDPSNFYAVLALVGVIGLLLGAILGFLLGSNLAGNAASSSAAPVTAPVAGGTSAPTLTQDQLATTTLPAGHPAIPTSGTATTP